MLVRVGSSNSGMSLGLNFYLHVPILYNKTALYQSVLFIYIAEMEIDHPTVLVFYYDNSNHDKGYLYL